MFVGPPMDLVWIQYHHHMDQIPPVPCLWIRGPQRQRKSIQYTVKANIRRSDHDEGPGKVHRPPLLLTLIHGSDSRTVATVDPPSDTGFPLPDVVRRGSSRHPNPFGNISDKPSQLKLDARRGNSCTVSIRAAHCQCMYVAIYGPKVNESTQTLEII